MPVAITSISISPVVGSVAAYYVATLISLNASSTSSFSTTYEYFIFASASANLIADSNCLGVEVITFRELPKPLISTYPFTNNSIVELVSLGLIFYLA